jgi:hypothetical protein
MLIIRPEQLEAFRQNALSQYVERTLEQFHQYFPGPCHVIGDSPLCKMIRMGVDRAAHHQIIGEGNVVLYISVMLLCGTFFDEDPQYPWAHEILRDEELTHEAQRAECLYDEFVAYWDRLSSGNRSSLIRAAMHTRKLPVEHFDNMSSEHIAEFLRQAWPQKAAELGSAGIDAVQQEGERCADVYHMETRRDLAVTSLLVFTLGSGFDRDPMHPWAADVLTSAKIPPADRGAHLYKAGQQYAERWIEFARQEIG